MTPLLLLALAAGPEFTPYEVDGKFRTAFPVAVDKVKSEVKDVKTDAGTLQTKTFTATAGKKLVLSVAYTDYPERFENVPADEFLKAVRDGVKTKDTKIESDKVLAADDANPAGREVDYDFGKYRAKVRLYKVKARLFVVTAAGEDDEVAGDTAKKFLTSFRVK